MPLQYTMAEHIYHVRAQWDGEASVWVASGDDVPGLTTEADIFEALVDKLRVIVPEMLELIRVLSSDAAARASFKVVAERLQRPRAMV